MLFSASHLFSSTFPSISLSLTLPLSCMLNLSRPLSLPCVTPRLPLMDDERNLPRTASLLKTGQSVGKKTDVLEMGWRRVTNNSRTWFAVLFLCFSSWAGKLDALSPQSPRHLYQVFFSSGAEGEPFHCRDCRMGVKAVRICREGEIGRGPSGGRPGVSDEGHPRERQALFWLMTGKPSYSSLPHIHQRRKKKKHCLLP